ncbi:CCA tRNA nucleotidyltransferase [Fructilactobacillus fructivorans]|uniref:CCA-adding enzyme n=1 Tax=Fructilactobacillus fructivorans TaxID=1614 RepID=A0A0C1PRT1_9LACO|nr:CCA tRNA nucleotidyltransferase [Fructilactobacillus fructivorans]KID42591.1 tRNA nucleotidyltransferase [Fructilactobacillus fructivorans]MCT0151817.1 CCA tRNA nucleotidyltransferase [Fructilactobacillus fructivorans]MCT2868054.1 CCA tRNA nucleotidyltransferase [Fructilactobacillus fructivorans]MCT2868706.1 CCA tRNA nucleotidyltransferase [Fructilactobacillus fructivorans]MCT2873363.1 CCA tRNA nucleotidyltransferase [Fructilactobacillus fructivorans]
MKIENLPNEFTDARKVLQVIEDAGYQAYFVGGSVRDTILHTRINDVDIASSAYPEEIKSIFKKTIDTGIEHGTVTVMYDGKSYEITTFRTESGYQDYRRPDQVTFVRSLKDDLKRRDFTINALAMKENGEVIDLFGGIDDLKKHIIRAVGDPEQRFNEDALRMMRAVRFASKLDFTIEAETFTAITKHSYLLKKIAVERINVEFVKMMLGKAPSRGLNQMIETKLIQYVPIFNNYVSNIADLATLSISDYLNNETQVWSLLAVQCGLNDDQINHMMKAWKCSNKLTENVRLVVLACRKIMTDNLDAMTMYLVGKEDLDNACQIALAFGHLVDDDRIENEYEHLPIKSKNELKINGKILINHGFKPGPQLGRVLKHLEQAVVSEQVNNDYDSLLAASKKIINRQ